MFYAVMAAMTAAIIGLDQWTKALVRAANEAGRLPSRSILGIFHITHAENTGAAWSILKGQTWVFVLVLFVFLALFGVMLWKKWLSSRFELICLFAIAGGGIGNLIDRLTRGSVTDMIALDFVNFPVFNVADCFITVGCFALIVYVLCTTRKKPDADPS